MKTKNRSKKSIITDKKTALILFLIVYPLTVLIRCLLAAKTHFYTTVLIDEHLYYSIARSIANGEGLLFMGQPANYTSILYPLMISPIYKLFPEGTNFFRIIQWYNICIMNLSLIPVYYLAKDITKDNKTAVVAGIISLLLPDMTLGGMILSESILYPLLYTMMFCAYRYLSGRQIKYLFLIGIIGGLILFTKPGQAATAFVILVYILIKGCKERDRKTILSGIAGLLCMTMIYAVGFLIVRVLLRQQIHVLGVYEDQLQVADGLHLWDFFRALILSPFCFYLMCCGILFVLPILNLRKQGTVYKDFFTITFISLAVLMVGTAWVVNRAEYMYSSIHLRYFASFVPLMLLLSLADVNHEQALFEKKAKNTTSKVILWGSTIYAVLCAFVFGLNAGIDPKSSIICYMSLAALRGISGSASIIVISIAFALAAFVISLLVILLSKKALCRTALVLTAFAFIVNTAYAYHHMHSEMLPKVKEDAVTVQEIIGNSDYLYVYATNKREYNAYLDPNTKKSVHMVYVNDLFNNTVKSKGVYQSFIPDVQRGTIPQYPTSDVSLFVIDQDAMKQVILSDAASKLTDDSLYMQAVSVPKDRSWVDAFLAGPVSGEIKKGTRCFIKIFNEDWRNRTVTVSLELDIKQATTFSVGFSDTSYSFELPAGKDTYSINLEFPTDAISFYAEDSDMTFFSFSIK